MDFRKGKRNFEMTVAVLFAGIVVGIIIGIKIANPTTVIETDKVKMKDSPGGSIDVHPDGEQQPAKRKKFLGIFKRKGNANN